MSSIVQNLQKKTTRLPVSTGNELLQQQQQGMRRRLSSLSMKIQPISAQTTSWAFQRSKSVSSRGLVYAGTSIRKWWEWSCSWILSRKPTFAQDLEMNEEETKFLGSHDKGSWRHVFYKVRSEVKKLLGSSDANVALPQTCKVYSSFDCSK